MLRTLGVGGRIAAFSVNVSGGSLFALVHEDLNGAPEHGSHFMLIFVEMVGEKRESLFLLIKTG